LPDLVDLVDVDDAALGQVQVESAAWSSRSRMFSTSSPTYPASVSVVASPMAKGTLSMRASVLASSVLPHPVGPTMSTLDFSNSTSFSSALSKCSRRR
jgi:hypothetical protein